jgi:uncharacterized protein (TIGR02147 family)
LNGKAHFSLEQAEKVSRFLGHTEDEREYFFVLSQRERAGTQDLERYFAEKIGQLLAKRQILIHRLGKEQTLSPENQSIYYSSWHYAAVHIATTIPSLRTRESISEFFNLPMKKTSDVVDYLVTTGLVIQSGSGSYEPGTSRVRLGNDSHNILKHHTNWRNQAIDSFDRETPFDLHYSGVLSISAEDKVKLKDMILDALKTQLAVADASKEEELYSYCIDFFSLKR